MNNWFIFFVQTSKEQAVCLYLNEILGNKESVTFFPKIKVIYKNSRKIWRELKPMFPGYVFTETTIDARSFINRVIPIMGSNKAIIKLLGKGNPDYMALREEEKKFILQFCDNKYIVGDSIGFIEGDKVFVTSGPLQGKESIIKRIDRHKRHAEIELEFMRDIRCVKVTLEIMEKA